MKVRGNLQFKDENHFVLVFVCVVEVDELVMVQVIHDVNLFPDLGQRSGHLHNSILLSFTTCDQCSVKCVSYKQAIKVCVIVFCGVLGPHT